MHQHAQIHESDVSAWICMFNTDWSVNISTCTALYICVCVCVCMPILVFYSDIPGGKEPHDCFHLLDGPDLFTSTGWVEVTSDFIHTRWGSLCLSLSFSLHASAASPFSKWESLFHIKGNDLDFSVCLTLDQTRQRIYRNRSGALGPPLFCRIIIAQHWKSWAGSFQV